MAASTAVTVTASNIPNVATSLPKPGVVQPAPQISKPEKPDDVVYKASLDKARAALAGAQELTKKLQTQINEARPGKDSVLSKQQSELRARLASIKSKQQEGKASRTKIQDRLNALDSQIKARQNDQKTAKSRIPFKNVEEVDHQIARLEAEVDTGKMKLVDEKKALAEITALRKQRKQLMMIESQQPEIDAFKAQLSDVKKELHDPAFTEMSTEYDKITKQLDEIKAKQNDQFKNLDSIRESLNKARAIQDAKYGELKSIQDQYHQQKRAYFEYEKEASRIREAKRKAEQKAYNDSKQKQVLEAKLEEASIPAYDLEIRTADNLLRLLDPTYKPSHNTSTTGELAAVAQRTVDDTEIRGTRLSKKNDDEENYFVGSQSKKNRKGSKARQDTVASLASSKPEIKDVGIFMHPEVIEQFNSIGFEPPPTKEAVPTLVQNIKSKRDFWAADSKRKTAENIAAAQNDFDRLVSGAANGMTGSSDGDTTGRKAAAHNETTTNGAVLDSKSNSDEADVSITEDIKRSSLIDGAHTE